MRQRKINTHNYLKSRYEQNSNNSTRIVVFRIFSAAMFKFLDANNSFSQTRSNSFTLEVGCLIGTISNSQVNDSELYKRILTLYNIRFSSVSVHAYTSIRSQILKTKVLFRSVFTNDFLFLYPHSCVTRSLPM